MLVNVRSNSENGDIWIVSWEKRINPLKKVIMEKEFRNGFSYAEGFARSLMKRGVKVLDIIKE